jgi:hypothetical protein
VKKLAVAGIVLAASIAFAPVAFAQAPAQPSAGCGAALLALSNAERSAADAVAADKSAADAKRADDDAADGKAAAETARAAALAGGAKTGDLEDKGESLRKDKKTILDKPGDPDQADQDQIVIIDAKLALIGTFVSKQAAADVAKTAADKTDADALRREADKTDAPALAEAAKKAEAAADKACGRNDGTPVRFENCAEVRAAGRAPLPASDPDYRVGLDSDRDGIACEATENTVTPTPSAPKLPTAIATGLAA